jgi:hypothetical protein
LFFFALLPLARADFSLPGMVSADSISGQFVVAGTPQFSQLALIPEIATNEYFVRLEPALLAVSAERIKQSIMEKLEAVHESWHGQIYLSIHPARTLDENVAIVPARFENIWVYHVILPDVLSRDRLVRALTDALLLEYANRNAGDHPAEVPSWLLEGFSQELMAKNLQEIILSAPDQTVGGVPMDRVSQTEYNPDTLADAREVLQNYSVLTYTQLSWPTDLQITGEDGGVYRSSCQLFLDELLSLHNGGVKLRTMLQQLPQFYNWQTAFLSAFQQNFSSPLDVEKWWALHTVIFSARSPGPQWTIAASREKLDEILSVAVEFRSTSNSLPNTAEISLQSVIHNFDSTRQTEILQTKLRDLELAQFRMAPSLAVLTAEYRNALAGYLGESPVKRNLTMNRNAPKTISAYETLKILNALDAQRRAIALATPPRFME